MSEKQPKKNKAFKFGAVPTDDQKKFFWDCFCARKFVWNKMLGDRMSGNFRVVHEDDIVDDMMSMFEISAVPEYIPITPAMYRKEFPWLNIVDSDALHCTKLDLNRAFREFYEQEKFKYSAKTLARCERQKRKPTFYELEKHPNFKSRKNTNWHSYTTHNRKSTKENYTIEIIDGKYIKLPKIGNVRIKMHRRIPKGYIIKSATISMTPDGKYNISVLTEYEETIKPVVIDEYSEILGLDYSMPELYVNHNNDCPEFDKWYRNTQDKLAREQRKMSNMVFGSNNYAKQKLKIAKLHRKVANQRKDFLHKESYSIAKNYDLVCAEDLDMKAMAQCLSFGKSVHDNGWGMFTTFLEYKLRDRGKHYIEIERSYPSSKLCHKCGWLYEDLKLDERTWTCGGCGTFHYRDHNAANNTRNRGIVLFKAQNAS